MRGCLWVVVLESVFLEEIELVKILVKLEDLGPFKGGGENVLVVILLILDEVEVEVT